MRDKLSQSHLALRKAIIAVVFLLCHIFIVPTVFGEPALLDRNVSLEVDGYKFEYQSIPVLDTSKKLMLYTGKITVSRIEKQQVIYEENISLQPGCDGFPPISKLTFKVPNSKLLGGNPNNDRSLVLLCGSYSGRHMTIKIFFNGPGEMRETALDFENTTPNVSATNGDWIYESVVYRRVMFDGELSTTPYLFVYALNVDSSSFGFSPQFGQGVAQRYLDYYQVLSNASKTEISPVDVGPMLGALFATKDKNTICREIKSLVKKGVQPAVVREWAAKLPNAGYPNFNLNICEEK